MEKIYQKENVYEATQERIDYIFHEFDNIVCAFSGGKDSGLLYHLVLKYMDQHGVHRKIGLMHQDFEAEYTETAKYVEKVFTESPDFVDRYWLCLPMAVRNAMSTFDPYWYPWNPDQNDIWVREMPEHPYVYTEANAPWFSRGMTDPQTQHAFGMWYRDNHPGKTIILLGLRAQESLHRYSAIANKRHAYDGKQWITNDAKNLYSASPIYDWETEDVWTAYGKFGFPYNKLYDLYYKAGVKLDDMRVASPFIEFAADSLNLYRVIEPDTWARVVGRVNGANFGSIYGRTKAMGYKQITLPPGHTWKSYTLYLLNTLPPDLRDHYVQIFRTSVKFWEDTGGGFSDDVIKDIRDHGYKIKENGISNFSKDGKHRIIFDQPLPDDTDDVESTHDIPSWKRMCYCILKNDYLCRFMGFGPTKIEAQRIKAIKQKYAAIARPGRKSK